jgi:LacI family transcriptional regulator
VTAADVKAWDVHGVIARVVDARLAGLLAESGLPVVNVSAIDVPEAKFPRVASDPEAAARMAAEYFLARGYRSFGYLSEVRAGYVERHSEGFRRALAGKGVSCDQLSLEPGGREHADTKAKLARWLETLPKPAALLTWSGGGEVVECCEEVGLTVPEDVAVLSGSDDDLLCEVCDVPISAVCQPTEQVGERAMDLLARWIEDGVRPRGAEWIAPSQIITRRSTDTLAVDDAALTRACRFLRENFAREIGVEDAAVAAGVSRRVLERRFAAGLGRSPGEFLRGERLRAARLWLTTTDLPIREIGVACGFRSPEYFVQAFREEEGVTPSRYRRKGAKSER